MGNDRGEIMSFVRFVILPDDRALIIGVAKQCDFLKQGVIYEIDCVLGEILVRELEETNLPKTGTPSLNSSPNDIIACGALPSLLATKEELKNFLNLLIKLVM
ncbi:MAG: hypothetical protein RL755_55 [Pseudomonadota bacterium]|jgi:hypothetical protein